MVRTWCVAAVAICALAGLVHAAEAPTAPLPLLAQTPVPAPLPLMAQTPPPVPSPWSGLYVGTEIVAVGGKGVKGGFGGDVFAGYNHEFANNIVLGIQGTSGYAPYGWKNTPFKGYDFAATSLKLGYDMGRFMPYVTAGVALAKINTGPGADFNASDSASKLFSSSGNLEAAPAIGAGFDYALTNNLQVGLGVSVGKAPALLLP